MVAIRACIPTCDKRVQLCPVVRGDNVAALSMVLRMRPKTENMVIIGREIALCLVHYSFLPAVYHTPGVAHVIADALLRIYDPSKPDAVKISQHPALKGAVLTEVPIRTPDYYKALEHASSLRK